MFRNLIWNYGGKLTEYLLSYAFSILTARLLGAGQNGVYLLILSIVNGGILFTSFGLEPTLHRFVPSFEQPPEALRGVVRNLLRFRILYLIAWALLFSSCYPVFRFLFPLPDLTRDVLILLALYTFFLGVNNFFGALVIGRARSHIGSIVRLLSRIVELLLLLYFAGSGLTVDRVFLCIGAGALVSTAGFIYFSRDMFQTGSVAPAMGAVRSFAATMWLNSVLVFVLGKQLAIILLGVWTGQSAEIGYFDVASMLTQSIVAAMTVGMSGVVLNTFSRISLKEPVRLYGLWRFWLKIGDLLVIPVILLVGFYADEIVVVLYTSAFQPSVLLIRIFVAFILVERLFGSGTNADLLLAVGRHRTLLKCSIGSGVLSLVLGCALIPLFKGAGAVIAVGAGNLLASILTGTNTVRHGKAAVPFMFWFRLLLITSAAAFLVRMINAEFSFIPVMTEIPVVVIIWYMIVRMVGLFSLNDIAWMEGLNPVAGSIARSLRIRT